MEPGFLPLLGSEPKDFLLHSSHSCLKNMNLCECMLQDVLASRIIIYCDFTILFLITKNSQKR